VRDLLREGGHDSVVGVGGGSALDVAKAAAALATNEGPATKYIGREKLAADPLPTVAAPTTAGTGSEVTMWSVLTDPRSGGKVSIGAVRLMPRLALLDPDLTLGLPAHITAATGMDALSHAVESYGSVWNHAIAEGMAVKAIELVGLYLRRAVGNGSDREARSGMLMASLVAELAANSTRLGLCHALAVPMGGRHHIPHGVANALLLPSVVAFNTPAAPDRYATVARLLGGGDDASEAIARLKEDVGLTGRLSDWGVEESDFSPLAGLALSSDNVQANPREAGEDELVGILRDAL
jgi:alcohol dehydrogenase